MKGRMRNCALMLNSRGRSSRINSNENINGNGSSRRVAGYGSNDLGLVTLTEQHKKIQTTLVSMADPVTGRPVMIESEARELALQFKSIDEFCDFATVTQLQHPPATLNPTHVASNIASVAFQSMASWVMPRRNRDTGKPNPNPTRGTEAGSGLPGSNSNTGSTNNPKNWFTELAEEDDQGFGIGNNNGNADTNESGGLTLVLISEADHRRNIQHSSWNSYLACFKPTADQMKTWQHITGYLGKVVLVLILFIV